MKKWTLFFRWCILLLLFSSTAFFKVYAEKDSIVSHYSIRFVKPPLLNIRALPTTESKIVTTIDQLEKVVVLEDNTAKEWIEVVFPFNGFVRRTALITERTADGLYYFYLNKVNEFQKIVEGYSPYNDLKTNNSKFDHTAKWEKEEVYLVRLVNAVDLNLREQPNTNSKVLSSLNRGDKLIIDNTFNTSKFWYKVKYPIEGFVYSKYIYSQDQNDSIYREYQKQFNRVKKALSFSTAIKMDKSKRNLKKYEKDQIVKPLISEHNNKYFVVDYSLENLVKDKITVEWAQLTDKDENGFNDKAKMKLEVETKPDDETKYYARIYARERNANDYHICPFPKALIFNSPKTKAFKANESIELNIGRKKHKLKQGEYDFRVEVFEKDKNNLSSILIHDKPAIENQKFESSFKGSIHTIEKNYQLSLLGHFAPLHYPIEKGLKNYKFPYGGNLEFGAAEWKLSFGIGYNTTTAITNSEKFTLQSDNAYFYLKYAPYLLMDNKLKPFVFAGATMWDCTWENIMYPEHIDYYPIEYNKGYSYIAGAGLVYNYKNFLGGLQYILYGSPQVQFGQEAFDPKDISELPKYEPLTAYYLYTGSNQLQLILGYQFQF